jgi:hypothetical protein
MNGADNMRHNPLHAPGRSMGSVDALSQGVPPIVLLGEARQMTGVMSVNWSQNSVTVSCLLDSIGRKFKRMKQWL